MAFDPLFINASAGAPSYTANELRTAMALAMMYGGRAVGARQGVRPGGTGYAVSVDGSLNITVQAGLAMVDPGLSTPQGPYWVAMTAADSTTLDVSPHDPTNPRIDIVYLRVQDHDEDGSGQRQAFIGYTAGTPAGSPVQPATPASALLLASLAVPAVSGAVAVTDRRVWTVATGGIVPVADQTARDALSAYAGLHAARIDQGGVTEHHNGTAWVAAGYRLLAIVNFGASGTFSKASFPGLRAVLVECLGSGGAGGGAAATAAGESSVGAGGRAGSWAQSLILESALASSETVTVGAAGVGVSGAAGGDGGQTSFGALVTAAGGQGGQSVMAAGTAAAVGLGAASSVGANLGDRTKVGGQGGHAFRITGTVAVAGYGGDSQFSGITRPAGPNSAGITALGRGGGGSGANNEASQAARAGGNGGAGFVIVYVYV